MHKEKGNSFIGQSKCARVVDSLYFNSFIYIYTYAYTYSVSSYNLFSTTIITVVTFLPVYVIWYHSYKKKRRKKRKLSSCKEKDKWKIIVNKKKVLCSTWSSLLIDFNNRFCLHLSKQLLRDMIYVKWYDLHTLLYIYIYCLEMMIWCW
jgi:hypothetical protein